MRLLLVRLQRLDTDGVGELLRGSRIGLFLLQLGDLGIQIGNGVAKLLQFQLRLVDGQLHFLHVIDEKHVALVDILTGFHLELQNLPVLIPVDLDLALGHDNAGAEIVLSHGAVAHDIVDTLDVDCRQIAAAGGQERQGQQNCQSDNEYRFFHKYLRFSDSSFMTTDG